MNGNRSETKLGHFAKEQCSRSAEGKGWPSRRGFGSTMTEELDFHNSSTCDRKQHFQGPEKAENIAVMMTEKYLRWIVPYHCKECGGWHLGNSVEAYALYGPVQYWLCAHCGRLIPLERRDFLLLKPGVIELTCSGRCSKYVAEKRRRMRRREEEEARIEHRAEE